MAAYLDTPLAIRRRRAFLAALMPMVGRDAALEAIDLWENAFGSEQPPWRGLSQFSTLVIQELSWKIKPEDLTIRLLEHLRLAEHMLPPDPGAMRHGAVNGVESLHGAAPALATALDHTHAAAQAPKAESVERSAAPRATQRNPGPAAAGAPAAPVAAGSNDSPSSRTLRALLIRLRDTARENDARLAKEVIRSFVKAARAQFPRDIAHDLGALMIGASPSLAHDYPRPRAVEVVNLLYVALAQLLGPVSADRLLTASVRAVEELPEARAFAPRDLL